MLRAAAAVTAAVLLLVACAGVEDVDRDDEGRPTEAGTVRADLIRVGDCFRDQEGGDVAGFAVVPCGEPHDNEVFHLFDVGGERYPGEESLRETAAERCEGRPFEDYVGSPVAASGYAVYQVVPSPDTWERNDDRTVVCVLYDPGGGTLRGSAGRTSA